MQAVIILDEDFWLAEAVMFEVVCVIVGLWVCNGEILADFLVYGEPCLAGAGKLGDSVRRSSC